MENSCMGRAIGEILPKYRRDMFIKIYDENKNYFIEKIRSSTKKVIIFSQIKEVVNHIADDLNASGIVTVKVTGDVKNNRLDIYTQFKEDDMTQVLCATSQLLGTGVTLVEANQIFFFFFFVSHGEKLTLTNVVTVYIELDRQIQSIYGTCIIRHR